jgi:hypothetical protein
LAAAGDDLDAQLRQRAIVDAAAQGTRREDVGLLTEDLVGRHRPGARRAGHALHALGVDVGDDEPGAGGVQLLGEVAADVAAPLDRDGLPLERVDPQRRRALAWMARKTPCAVTGDGSPEAPARPAT